MAVTIPNHGSSDSASARKHVSGETTSAGSLKTAHTSLSLSVGASPDSKKGNSRLSTMARATPSTVAVMFVVEMDGRSGTVIATVGAHGVPHATHSSVSPTRTVFDMLCLEATVSAGRVASRPAGVTGVPIVCFPPELRGTAVMAGALRSPLTGRSSASSCDTVRGAAKGSGKDDVVPGGDSL